MRDPDKLVSAFRHMVEDVYQSVQKAEASVAPTIDTMVNNAKDLARDLYTLTREESDMLADVLRRDFRKARQALHEQEKDIRQWINFDLDLAEDRFIDLVARSADKAWLDFRKFETEDHQASRYRSGEVCNPGNMSCETCNSRLILTEIGQISDCANCGNQTFFRVIG